MARPRGADSAAGSLRGLPHRPGDLAAQPDVPEAPREQERQAPIRRSAVLTFPVTAGFSELRELVQRGRAARSCDRYRRAADDALNA